MINRASAGQPNNARLARFGAVRVAPWAIAAGVEILLAYGAKFRI